jgi:hypothetical protein
MIGIDTFSWSKLFLLRDEYQTEIIDLCLDSIRFFITHEVEEELIHFHNDKQKIWKSGALLPRLNRSFQNYIQQGFDLADASLLEYSELPDYLIVTEDYPMLSLNISNRNNIIQLGDFFLLMLKLEVIDLKNFRELLKWLRKNRNLTKKKFYRLSSID